MKWCFISLVFRIYLNCDSISVIKSAVELKVEYGRGQSSPSHIVK